MTVIASVHRFRNYVAVSVGNGETTYLNAGQAEQLATALIACAHSVNSEKYCDSKFEVFEIPDGAA